MVDSSALLVGAGMPTQTPRVLMVESWAAKPIDGRTVFCMLSGPTPIDGREPDAGDRLQKSVIRFARVML